MFTLIIQTSLALCPLLLNPVTAPAAPLFAKSSLKPVFCYASTY